MIDDVNVHRWSQEPRYGHYRYTSSRTPQTCLPSQVMRSQEMPELHRRRRRKRAREEEQRTGLIMQFHLNLFEYIGVSSAPTTNPCDGAHRLSSVHRSVHSSSCCRLSKQLRPACALWLGGLAPMARRLGCVCANRWPQVPAGAPGLLPRIPTQS